MPFEIQEVKQPVSSSVHAFVWSAMLLLSTLAAFAANTTVPKALAGTYVARVAMR